MPNLPGLHDDVYFGGVDSALPNWRRMPDSEPDDAPLSGAARQALVGMLGFDPRSESFAEESEPRLLAVPDVPQPDSFSCGAASAMAVGRYYGVGPTDLESWKRLLGTDPDAGTPPQAIVRVLRGLGLRVEARQDMTLDDLRQCWQQGSPVICPIQDYGPAEDRKADEAGHYVTVVGVALEFVFVQDSMQDVELEGSNSDAEPGRVMIDEQRFLRVWHDRGADGAIYRRFGIIVSR